jgi:hypothetical protein
MTLTLAEADLVVSAALAALTDIASEGTRLGAVYNPEARIVPTVELPPTTPLTVHWTVVLLEFVTVAEN